MTIRALLFAVLRERAGAAEVELPLAEGATIADAVHVLVDRFPRLRDVTTGIAFAVNYEYVDADTVLSPGDELALIPPVSGG